MSVCIIPCLFSTLPTFHQFASPANQLCLFQRTLTTNSWRSLIFSAHNLKGQTDAATRYNRKGQHLQAYLRSWVKKRCLYSRSNTHSLSQTVSSLRSERNSNFVCKSFWNTLSPRKHGNNFTRLAVINFLICRGMFICHPALLSSNPYSNNEHDYYLLKGHCPANGLLIG